ncbi:MAG: hypothetical protein M1836_001330 [Candelina mexicana]|nr:MAG: hypothetical protein M1836_001330 [Candelina mexicana]
MADSTPKSYSTDPTLYLYTSLTAGSSHIITATSRLETILKANKIPYQALDVATDEKARMLWGRRAGKRKLPGLVRLGMIVGDLEEIEEWNEYGELKENIGPIPGAPSTPSASTTNTPSKPPSQPSAPIVQSTPSTETKPKEVPGGVPTPLNLAMRQAGEEAAQKAKDNKSKPKHPSSEASKPDKVSKAEAPNPEEVSEPVEDEVPAPSDKESLGPSVTRSTLSSLDSSKPVPPPSGGIDTTSAPKPEKITSSANSKAESISQSAEASESKTSLQPDPLETPAKGRIMQHRGSEVGVASAEEIRDIESRNAIAEEEEDEATEGTVVRKEDEKNVDKDADGGKRAENDAKGSTESAKLKDIEAIDLGEDLPGEKIHKQAAGSEDAVGDSVAD